MKKKIILIADNKTHLRPLSCTSLLVEIPLVLVVMSILTIPSLIKGKLRRWQGIVLLGLYAAFIVMQVCIALR